MSCRIIQRIVDQDKTLQAELTDAGVDLDLVFALVRGHPTPELLVSKPVENAYIHFFKQNYFQVWIKFNCIAIVLLYNYFQHVFLLFRRS